MVRQVGTVRDLDDYPVAVGIDYDTVTIGVCKLDESMAAEFAQLFIAACWQAAANAERMRADA
jgi:hypothetical protein